MPGAIAAVNRALPRSSDGRKGEGPMPNPIRAQSVSSYAATAIMDDDGTHEWYECWFMCRYQIFVRRWYASDLVQVSVAVFIFLNFIVEASAAQLGSSAITFALGPNDPYASEDFFYVMELFFTILFTIELMINMFAYWWWRFWQDGWNIFDFLVVSVSLLAIMGGDLPGIAVLRLLRAFRVFRLFKRLENLRKIVKALEESIPGVANAFMILILVMGIFAILGVEFFKHDFVHPVWGNEYNYFLNFGEAMFTLFQVMTGESWSEMIARPCIRKQPTLGSVYFVLYVLLTMFVLVNVVIAVLLEKLMGDVMSTDVDDTYDVFCYGREFVRRTDLKNKGEEDAILLSPEERKSLERDSWDSKRILAENSCIYCHVYPAGAGPGAKWKKVKADIEGKNVLIVPRPDPDDPDPDAEEYDDEGNLIEVDKNVQLKVEQFRNRMCCTVTKVTRMSYMNNNIAVPINLGKSGYDLIRIELEKIPLVLEAVELFEWKTGKRMDKDTKMVKFVKKCDGDPKTRTPKKRDIVEQYQIPPEPMAGLIKRIDDSLQEYMDLLAWRLQCVNAHLDNMHNNGTAKRVIEDFQLPKEAEYTGNPDNPGDNVAVPNIIPPLDPPDDGDTPEQKDADVDVVVDNNGYEPEVEGGTKTDDVDKGVNARDPTTPDSNNVPQQL